MTKPTITYGHGYKTDCDDTTGWTENLGGMTDPQTSLTTSYDDIFTLTGVCDDAGDEYVYYEKDITNISSDVYTRFLVRWKTSAASNGLGCHVQLVFSDASTQDIVGTAAVPLFNISWTQTSGTITSGKTIDKIRISANDYPNSVDSGTFYVYFDFILLHRGTFTFPFISDIESVKITNRIRSLEIPGRVGNVEQYLGMDSPKIHLSGKTDIGTGWHDPAKAVDLADFYRIMYDAYTDVWQWFTSDLVNCKVLPLNFEVSKVAGSKHQCNWSVDLEMYRRSSQAAGWTYDDYFEI